MTTRIFLKLLLVIVCLMGVAMAAVDFLASRVAESTYVRVLARELGEKGRMLAAAQGGGLDGWTDQNARDLARAAGARLTLIAKDGRVIVDSEARADHMENHGSRPEVKAALAGSQGWSSRTSSTVGVRFLYVAVPVSVGALRLAMPLAQIDQEVLAIRKEMLLAVMLVFLPAIAVAAWFARGISARMGKIIDYVGDLAAGNFRSRLDVGGGGELALLGGKLNDTGQHIRQMVEQLQRDHAALEKLERIRKDFVANVSHELRTPLASIQGYTETLLDGAHEDSATNLRFLRIVRQNAERLARLTDDLLTLSQIELETREFLHAPHSVISLLTDAADSMEPLAAKKSIQIAVVPQPASVEVFCDAQAVQQVLGNLVDNAIKYTPEGGAIELGASPVGGENIEIYVKDTGSGIPAEDLPRLFERFYRVDKARSRELGGTGLGLAIVKHLVRAQGGDVRVESTPQRGSTFYFTLPSKNRGEARDVAVHSQFIHS